MAEELKKFDELINMYNDTYVFSNKIDYDALVEYLKTQPQAVQDYYQEQDNALSQDNIFGEIWEEL